MRRFAWTIHNMIAHPISEVLWQLGLREWSQRLHDSTVPRDER